MFSSRLAVRMGIASMAVMIAACAVVAPSPPASTGPTAALAPSDVPTSVPPGQPADHPAASGTTVPSAIPPSGAPGLTPVPAGGDAVAERILATIDQSTGGALLDLTPEAEAWGVQLDGTVDDGQGPGRLFVVVSTPGGNAENLCQDREFVQGGRCRRIDLPGGDVRFERGLVDSNGVQTVDVAIRRVDGSGVMLEAGNFSLEAPPVLVSGQPRPTPQITRTDPVLSLEELVDLADAISAATRDCSATVCP